MDNYGTDFKGTVKIESVATLPAFVSAAADERRLIYCEDTEKVYRGSSTAWVDVGPAGSNTYVQYNNSGAPGASSTFTFTVGTGTVTATIFNSTSQRKFKKNIKPFKKDALEIINSVKVKEFNFKNDKEKTYRVGFISDDTDSILSGKNKDIVDINNTIGVLLKAVQELSARVKELEKA